MITFTDLESHVGTEVQITGFLYEASEQTCILAPMPNLKSCCVRKADPKILVESKIEASKQAITLQGILLKETEGFYLRNAQIVEPGFPYWTLSLLFCIPFVFLFKKRRHNFHRRRDPAADRLSSSVSQLQAHKNHRSVCDRENNV